MISNIIQILRTIISKINNLYFTTNFSGDKVSTKDDSLMLTLTTVGAIVAAILLKKSCDKKKEKKRLEKINENVISTENCGWSTQVEIDAS